MPRSVLRDGVDPAADDGEVIRALLRSASPADGTSLDFTRVGVKNDAGVIYRAIKLYGDAEMAQFVQEMALIGYEDEGPAIPFVAVFAKPSSGPTDWR